VSPLLFLAAMAFAQGPEGQFDRLFTAEGATPAAAAAEPGAVPAGGWAWPALLSGGGLLAAWQLRKRTVNGAPADMRVVQRQALGDKSALVLVEVPDASGGTRRLLLGSANGSLSLLNDLGLAGAPRAEVAIPIPVEDEPAVPAAPVAELAAPDPVEAPPASTTLAPADDFARMLGEVLDERRPAAGPSPAVPEGRFFAADDLAPPPDRSTEELMSEFGVAPVPRRNLRRARAEARNNHPAPRALRVLDADADTPVAARSPLAARNAVSRPKASANTTVAPTRVTVAAAPEVIVAHALAPDAAPRKSGLSALVKDTLPSGARAVNRPRLANREEARNAAEVNPPAAPVAAAPITVALPAPVVNAPAPVVNAPVQAVNPPAGAKLPTPGAGVPGGGLLVARPLRPVAAAAPAAPPAAAPRTMFTAPSLGGNEAAAPERRQVGPPLRDPRLVAPSAGPRLRLAGDPGAAETEVPATHELLARLRAQHAEPERLVANGNDTTPSRADGLKRRFEAITAAGGGR
jgi:hypothetical protein